MGRRAHSNKSAPENVCIWHGRSMMGYYIMVSIHIIFASYVICCLLKVCKCIAQLSSLDLNLAHGVRLPTTPGLYHKHTLKSQLYKVYKVYR